MATSPYTVQLHLNRSVDDSVREGRFDVELVDAERTSTTARAGTGVAFLDLRRQSIPGLGLTVGELLTSFLGGAGGTQEDGLLFGRHLLDRLLGDREVRVLWDEIQARRRAEKRPLRLELLLPADDAGVVADIPFELLADETGFLFRQVGATLVRAIRRLPVRAVEIAPGDAVMVAWANPQTDNVLPQALFDRHEEGTRQAAEKVGLTVKAPCRQATLRTLEERLAEGGGTPIVSLVAHGDRGGGVVWLHRDPSLPGDPGDPVVAADLAHGFRRGGVKVVLLWTCHGGKHDAVSGALAAKLLDPAHGDVAAVVASHAALRASSTADVVERLFTSLRVPAGGDLERAVSEARLALSETDLQWAAPVYYARPTGGRSVTLADALEKEAESRRVPEAPRPGEVEGAPGRWPHFRGRGDEIARGMAYLRTGRLVSVTGMAGMGKTEVALEIAREAARDAELGLGRVIWLGLDGVGQAEGVRARLAFAFGAEPKDCPDDAALVRRISGARALVVLDNAEDPIRGDRGGVRALVDTMLRGCSGLKVMLATRERLGDVRGEEEHEVRVGKLGEGDARAVFLSVAGERLGAEEHGSAALGEVLAWLDGHALSLVLVAKQVGTMALPALLRRLEKQGAEAVHAAELFGEEAGGDRDERLTRLVSSLDLSYRPLAEKTPGAAEMFAWLGYFPAGLPGVLVPTVFGEEGEERRAILLRKGLAEEIGREKRLVLPAPVRAYARAQMGKVVAEERRSMLLTAGWWAMAAWMVALHQRLGTSDAREVVKVAVREQPNLESLVSLLGASRQNEEQGRTLNASAGMALWHWARLLWHTRDASQGIGLLRSTCDAMRHMGLTPDASLLHALGELYVRTDQIQDAEEPYAEALRVYQAKGDWLGEAHVQVLRGNLFVRTSRLPLAVEAYDDALRAYRVNGDQFGEANVCYELGCLYMQSYRLADAEAVCDKAIRLYQIKGERTGTANALRLMGDLRVRRGCADAAEAAYEEALAIFREIGDRLGEANALLALVDSYVRTARLDQADRAQERALVLYDELDDRLGKANALASRGEMALARRLPAQAFSLYREALSLHRSIGHVLGVAGVHVYMARAALRAARPLQSVVLASCALRILDEVDDRYNRLPALGVIAQALSVMGREGDANMAVVLEWACAAEVDHPRARQLSDLNDCSAPDAGAALFAQVNLTAVLSDCEAEFYALGEDLYAVLAP